MQFIRGATTAQNTIEEISCRSTELFGAILRCNNLDVTEVVAVFFTMTADLTAANPCTAVRKKFGLDSVAFMCAQEAAVDGGLPTCIRVCVVANAVGQSNYVYLHNAANLRCDLKK